jgi:nucleoside-diphosphate-sugar epimerase
VNATADAANPPTTRLDSSSSGDVTAGPDHRVTFVGMFSAVSREVRRVVVVGGTRFVGPSAVRALLTAGHSVAVAHSGAHESPLVPAEVEHLHADRAGLLAPGGPVERWRPDALVDTFHGGASEGAATQLTRCATRAGVRQVIVISSLDVYRRCVETGIGDGSGAVPLPQDPVPLDEDAPLRDRPYPGARPGHDNVAAERALRESGVERITVLRPGTIYGPNAGVREWSIVWRVHRGERRLPLPDGGGQMFHRVSVHRIGAAVAAALRHAPSGCWACNVVDPFDWDFAGLAREVGRLLQWEWEPVRVSSEIDAELHPWALSHPVLASDRRLRETLRVTEPDPRAALAETVRWLWENRSTLPPPP